MNLRFDHHMYRPKDGMLSTLAWLAFCISLWALAILLCETVIEHLYFR